MCTSTARSWWDIRSESTIPAGSSQGTSSCPKHAPRAWKGALRTTGPWPTPRRSGARAPGGASRESPSTPDRKSTRLNSSHSQISYAVFCLKKKRTCGNHGAHEHTAVVIYQSEIFSLRWILQFRIGDREIGVFVILPVADVLQKTIHHRCGNHVGHALRDVAAISLKRHANDFAVLHHGAAAVARVDLRADLDRQMLVN